MKRTNVVIDWLQINCKGVVNKSYLYDYQELGYRTKQFNKIIEVYKFGELFCTMAFEPIMSTIPKDFILIKFSNKYLYRNMNLTEIKNFIDDHCIRFSGITRIDLACDFNNFMYNLECEQLIHKFMCCKYTKTGKSKYKVMGYQGERQHYEYLRFGMNTSAISSYLYNKSQEFRDKEYKPYIEENWKNCGLDIKKEVWRLEFSIKGSKIKFYDQETSEYLPITLGTIFDYSYLESVYTTLLNGYFHFKYNKSNIRKSRLKDVVLFDFKTTPLKNIILQDLDESNRMQKIFIRMIEDFNCQLRLFPDTPPLFSHEQIMAYARKYNLQNYYMNKVKC